MNAFLRRRNGNNQDMSSLRTLWNLMAYSVSRRWPRLIRQIEQRLTTSNLEDNCIQFFHLGRYIVGYTVGNFILRRRVSGAVKRDFQTYIRQYTSPNESFEYGYPHSNALLTFSLQKDSENVLRCVYTSNGCQLHKSACQLHIQCIQLSTNEKRRYVMRSGLRQ